jgi:hypothetical protein
VFVCVCVIMLHKDFNTKNRHPKCPLYMILDLGTIFEMS